MSETTEAEAEMPDGWLAAVPAYLADELTPEDRAAFDDALATDAKLQQEVTAVRTLLTRLHKAPVPITTPIFKDKLYRKLYAQEARSRAAGADMLLLKIMPIVASLILFAMLGQVFLSGGRSFLSPEDSRRPAARPLGIPLNQQYAINQARLDGAAWLAKTQRDDGSWDLSAPDSMAAHQSGVTGLALIAFIEASGEAMPTSLQGPSRRDIARSVKYLLAQQDSSGRFGPASSKSMYNHAIVTLSLLKAYERLPRGSEYVVPLKSALDRAVAVICAGQTDSGGWGYFGHAFESPNLAVTAWQMHALNKAVQLEWSDVQVPFARGMRYVRTLVEAGGNVQYNGRGRRTNTLSAMGAFCLLLSDEENDKVTGEAILARLLNRLTPDDKTLSDAYADYFLTRAVYLSGAAQHARTLDTIRRKLLGQQVTTGDNSGSFRMSGPWQRIGGSVFTTAIATASL